MSRAKNPRPPAPAKAKRPSRWALAEAKRVLVAFNDPVLFDCLCEWLRSQNQTLPCYSCRLIAMIASTIDRAAARENKACEKMVGDMAYVWIADQIAARGRKLFGETR